MSALQTLMEMGFSENASKKALAVVGGGGIEQAMEWLLAHADDPSINDEPTQAQSGHTVGTAGAQPEVLHLPGTAGAQPEKMEVDKPSDQDTKGGKLEASAEGGKLEASAEGGKAEASAEEEKAEASDEEDKANSIKCDDCGKLFSTSEEVEYHAVKSGHENFSESTEEKKPLTEEEKLEKKRRLAEKIKERRKEREAEEEQEVRERERKRIQMGQAMAERKRQMQEMEIKKAVEERKRDKLEDKLARQRVKDQIEKDRQARKEMFPNKSQAESKPPQATPQPSTPVQPAQKKEYTTTRLQIRLPTGTPLVQEFKAKESLSAVRLWVGLNRQDGLPADAPLHFSMTFPRKTFSEEDMDKPLDLLGLVPSAVLMVTTNC